MANLPKFSINSSKRELINIQNLSDEYAYTEEDRIYNYNPFLIEKIQFYNPLYSQFLDINTNNIEHTTIDHEYSFLDMNTVIQTQAPFEKKTQPSFIKFSPLLDPIHYMIGKYKAHAEKTQILPSIDSDINNIIPKINHLHNASYVDGFFSFLSNQLQKTHGVIHGIQYFGSYVGLQNKFKMNITDDFEYLHNSSYFTSNINKLFTISDTSHMFSLKNNVSHDNRPKLNIQTSAHNLSEICVIEIEPEIPSSPSTPIEDENELVYEKNINSSSHNSVSTHSSSSSSATSYSEDDSDDDTLSETNDDEHASEADSDNNSDIISHSSNNTSRDQDSDNSSDSNVESIYSSSEDEPQIYAYVDKFPVHMICLEKCENTLDHLFLKNIIDETEGASALFQIIMTLIIYQKAFHFTHNDLHTNNIMYVNTEVEYLYYEFNQTKYRVPTYGRIYKIIDFGRSIYKFQNRVFCSDSFMSGGDASTQYNFGPFINTKKPCIEPNYSFDLCRLGCSIYDFIIDDDDEYRDLDDFQKIIYKWCLDDHGKSVLYKKNGEERYKDFKLYKMIARTVHNHVPHDQLSEPIFSQYQITAKQWNKFNKDKTLQGSLLNIDEIPSYV